MTQQCADCGLIFKSGDDYAHHKERIAKATARFDGETFCNRIVAANKQRQAN